MKKDKSKEPPVYLVFFKGRDQDALNAAFREFSQKQIQKANKPSIHKRLAAYRAMMPKKTKDKVKNQFLFIQGGQLTPDFILPLPHQTFICNGTRRPDFCWFCVKQ